MEESVVAVALASVEKQIILLYKNTKSPKFVHYVFEKGKRCLQILQAYLWDSEYQTSDGKSILQMDRRACIDIASAIQDILDELMYKLLQHLPGRRTSIFKRSQNSPLKVIVQDACRRVSEYIERTVSMVDMENARSMSKVKCQSSADETFDFDHFRKNDPTEEAAIGFEMVQQKIIEQLTGEDPAPSNIGIFGMGGCGKTTLAKMVFDSVWVQDHFSCKAWINASQPNIPYRDLIMSQFGLKKENESADTDKASRLREYLHNKRYLIVIDDIWRVSDWKAIQHALPKSGKEGSRVVLITRNSHIVSSSARYIHDLSSGLSPDHARELFCRKAFQNRQGKPPPVLGSWPEKFVKLCEGLPLAITTLGTWLSTKEHNPSVWENKYNLLGQELGKADSYLSVLDHNLQLSFSHLPSHLRSCFLYMSMFPEGQSLSRERLLRLWIAEGFVTPERGATVEQTAEGYLNELVARNLIMVTSYEGRRGRVKRCRVSHLVHKINASRHKSFATVVGKNYSADAAGENSIHRFFIVKTPSKLTKDITGSCVRSFLLFDKPQLNELKSVFESVKFIRVLDLNGADLNEFPSSIVQLFLLTYLSLRNNQIEVVPKSIGNLLSLETLDLKNTVVSKLPQEIGKLERLRHLLLFDSTKSASGGVAVFAKALRALSSIKKLSLVKVDRQLLKVLGELIGLRKLGLTDLRKEDGKELCACIEKMQNLSTLDVESISENEYLDLGHMLKPPLYLQHLYLRGRLTMTPKWISELTSLSKVVLRGSKLESPTNPLEAIQDLPNLTELELVDYFIGDVFTFKAKKFLKLVKFAIKRFENLTLVTFEHGALPSLKNLVLQSCMHLKTLPVGIDSLTLRELLLYDMPDILASKLRYYDKYRQLVKHIRVVRSYIGWNNGTFDEVADLSPSVLKASTSENQTSISLKIVT